jgi:hypothetical protein
MLILNSNFERHAACKAHIQKEAGTSESNRSGIKLKKGSKAVPVTGE